MLTNKNNWEIIAGQSAKYNMMEYYDTTVTKHTTISYAAT